MHIDSRNYKGLRELVYHHHLDGMVSGHGVADPYTLHTSFASIHRNKGSIPLFIKLNRIGLWAELGTECTLRLPTDLCINICH